ncbi:hypothetical protein DRN46_00870 [Thermococci archaeon]|nr:MAG: hypothetical protein DRN46_00870 [Thermococci archaeon]RLF97083.1 MAG: hypothetical protein DRN52_01225 [Thermococci archaeon]
MVVVITGVSSGLGELLSKEFCSRGWEVLGVSRNWDKLREMEENVDGFRGFHFDFRGEPREIIKRALDLGGLDVLVNNAGFGLAKSISEHTPREAEEILRVNLLFPVKLTLEAIPHLKRALVNVISAGALIPLRNYPIYGAAKSALGYFSLLLRKEMKGKFAVINVYPGPMKTKFFERAGGRTPILVFDPEKLAREIVSNVERGKSGEIFYPRFLSLVKLISKLCPQIKV